jgi:hypothetical protein
VKVWLLQERKWFTSLGCRAENREGRGYYGKGIVAMLLGMGCGHTAGLAAAAGAAAATAADGPACCCNMHKLLRQSQTCDTSQTVAAVTLVWQTYNVVGK